MAYKIEFSKLERDLLVQILELFCKHNNLSEISIKNKIENDKVEFEEKEIILLYLYINQIKKTYEKYLDDETKKDNNMLANYKGFNHCLRKCRIALEKHGIDISSLKQSFENFADLQDFK